MRLLNKVLTSDLITTPQPWVICGLFPGVRLILGQENIA